MQLVSKTVNNVAADTFTAIAHPLRRQILDHLRDGDLPVKQLAANFEVSRPAISQHLKVLLEVNLVSELRVGREHFYHLQAGQLQEVEHWVSQYTHFWNQKLDALGSYLEKNNRKETEEANPDAAHPEI